MLVYYTYRHIYIGASRRRCVAVHSFASKRVCIMDARSRPFVVADPALARARCFVPSMYAFDVRVCVYGHH